MLSNSFNQWVAQMTALDAIGVRQAAQPLRRNESVREFFANRSSK